MNKAVNAIDASDNIYNEMIGLIKKAFIDAKNMRVSDYNTTSLATVSSDGNKPSVRTITISDIGDTGLLFFANNLSAKAQSIKQNPHVGLCFYWPELRLQIIAQGVVKEMSREEAAKWWGKRDRNFQLTAWLSDVRYTTQTTDEAQQKRISIKQSFVDERIPLPANWSAYRIALTQVEFWRANWKSASERYSYQLNNNQWSKHILVT